MNYLIISLLVLCLVTVASCAAGLAVHVHRQKRWKEDVCNYLDMLEREFQDGSVRLQRKIDVLQEDQKNITGRLDGLCTNMESIDWQMDEFGKKFAYSAKKLEMVDDDITGLNLDMEKVSQYKAEIDALRESVDALKLDYREAQNAASQINDYAGHLANIFSYDPLEERKKSRKESGDG